VFASRKATLEMILAKSGPGIRFNEHMEADGETVFRHACKSNRGGRSPFFPSFSRLALDLARNLVLSGFLKQFTPTSWADRGEGAVWAA
jgi:hypothetical protein